MWENTHICVDKALMLERTFGCLHSDQTWRCVKNAVYFPVIFNKALPFFPTVHCQIRSQSCLACQDSKRSIRPIVNYDVVRSSHGSHNTAPRLLFFQVWVWDWMRSNSESVVIKIKWKWRFGVFVLRWSIDTCSDCDQTGNRMVRVWHFLLLGRENPDPYQ